MGLNKELDGLLVVSLEQAVAAPYCGLLLADAGARVIKVERPEGDFARSYDAGADGQSAIFAWLNRGKESICLDLKTPQDKGLLRKIAMQADVLVSNLAPGAVARMGFDGATLRADNPGLITCTVTGYGDTGPGAGKKAYDFLVQGESGVCSVTGTAEAPVRVGVSMTDLSSGLTAFSAILRALIQRGRTGKGVDLTVSMFDVMADWMNMPLLLHRQSGIVPERTGLQHGFVAPYGGYTCGDGEQVLLSIQNNREWAAFCDQVLSRPELTNADEFVDNPQRFANRAALDAIINNVFGTMDRAAVVDRLDRAKIANARLNTVADLSVHSLLRESVARIGATYVDMAALPVMTDGGTPVNVPALDEHGAAIRAEFGCSGVAAENRR